MLSPDTACAAWPVCSSLHSAKAPAPKGDWRSSDAALRSSSATFSSVAVMLRLRVAYVSKAAILKLPVRMRRSKIEVHLEFQGLGSLGA